MMGDVINQSQLDFAIDGIELKPEQKAFKNKSRKLTTERTQTSVAAEGSREYKHPLEDRYG